MPTIIRTKRFWLKIIVGFFAYKVWAEFQKLESDDPTIWKTVIKAFEEEDQAHRPQRGSIIFIGSSSIRFASSD